MSRSGYTQHFSLGTGGPFYQLLILTRLARPPLANLRRRLVIIPSLAWIPLLVLSLVEGRAVGGVAIPFLYDIEAYTRFLIAIPLLVAAEVVLHRCLSDVMAQFWLRGMLPRQMEPRFQAAIASAARWRDSRWPELAMLVIVLVTAPLAWHYSPALQTSSWHTDVETGNATLTMAGWWFVLISAPLSHFLMLRLYFRLLIWCRLQWTISHIPLRWTLAHPDRSGGIGFLEEGISGFLPVLFAQSITASGFIASRVLFDGRNVLDFRLEVLMLVVALVILILLPLLLWIPRLVIRRWSALQEYGVLATTYVRDFEGKWLGPQPPGEELVGSADIQSLADLAGSYEIVGGMRLVPFGSRAVMQVLAVCLVPFIPLVFTVYSFPELLGRLAKVFL